ncbi:MAG: HAD family hydrolase [Anaerolineales bacterium]|nr:MAG: HAD family hydrolase [Anaerolineales bacterium]
MMFDVIAFDADDTLWSNMALYENTQHKLALLLTDYIDAEALDKLLFATETRNIRYFGYGIKSFTLSMIETAVKIMEDDNQNKIHGDIVLQILGFAKYMLTAPVHLIDHVADVLAQVAPSYELMVITKGDLLDQQGKVDRSGLAGYFSEIEVVIEKNPETYARILHTHRIDPRRVLMVGNSLKSDVLPVLDIGGNAVHIPHALTWAHEEIDINPESGLKHIELEHIGLLPAWLKNGAG